MARPSGPATKIYPLRERVDKPSPYVLAWKYRGRSTQRSFTSKTEAERARYKLQELIEEAAPFNTTTGWPIAWENRTQTTVAEACHAWMWANHSTWEPHTRRSAAEPIANLILHLVKPKSSALPPSGKMTTRKAVVVEVPAETGMRKQIYDWLATDPSEAVVPAWVARNSLPLGDVTAAMCEAASKAMMTKSDNTPKSPTTQARFRTNVRAYFDWCIAQKLMPGPNPWPAAPANRKRTRLAKQALPEVRVRTLPTGDQVSKAINSLINSGRAGRRARGIVLGLEYYAGLRPGEAVALTIENCDLPTSGWGRITVSEAKSATSKRWTLPGEDTGRPKTEPRVTTIPPAFVKQLRSYIGKRTTGLVAPNERGGMLDIANVNRTFAEACKAELGKTWRQYDLRAARASLHANSGRPHAQVAREMGHSVVVLQSVYLGTNEDDLTRGLNIVESRLREKKPAAKKVAPPKKKAPAKKRASTTSKRRAPKTAAKTKKRR
jgi:integrase